MKMLEIKWNGEMVRFALESVRSYGIVKRPKVRKTPAHHVVKIVLQPSKVLDNDGRGFVVDFFDITEWEFESLELAESAVTVIDI